MSTVQVTYYYDRVGWDCHTDGEVCERGYYAPGGWHYGKHLCRTCRKDAGPYPRSKKDLAACQSTSEASEVIEDVRSTLGAIDHVQHNDDHIMAYSADNCAGFSDGYHETRQAAIKGDRRLLDVLYARLTVTKQDVK